MPTAAARPCRKPVTKDQNGPTSGLQPLMPTISAISDEHRAGGQIGAGSAACRADQQPGDHIGRARAGAVGMPADVIHEHDADEIGDRA